MNHRNSSSARRPSLLRRGLATAAAGLLGAAVLAAPTVAHASWTGATVGEWALEGIVGQLAGDGVSALLFGTSTTTKLSSTDITQIQTLITAALSSYVSTTITTEASDVISKVAAYQRGTTASDLSTAMTSATTIVNDADDVLNAITGQSSATSAYSLASTYKTIALIKIAFLQEQQAIVAAQCAQGSCSSVNYGAKVVAAAEAALAQLDTFYSDFEGQFPSDAASSFTASWENDYSVNGSKSSSFLKCTENTGITSGSTQSLSWCVTYTPYGGSSKNICPQTDYSTMSVYPSTGSFSGTIGSVNNFTGVCTYKPVTSGTETTGLGVARAWFKNFKGYQRDQQLGSFFFESMAALEKAAAAVYGFCGDQVCSPSEAAFQMSSSTGTFTTSSQCASDCSYVGTSGSSTSSTKQAFATLSFGTLSQTYTSSPVLQGTGRTYTTSQAATLLTADGAHLDWLSNGNLVLYASSGSTLWQSNTNGLGARLVLQTDGNVVIYDSNGTAVWSTQAFPSTRDQYTYRPVYLMLADATLSVVDSSFHAWWSSDTDAHAYGLASSRMSTSGASPRYCWTKGTSDQTLASNTLHSLKFGSDGVLRVKDSAGVSWWQSGLAGNSGTAVSGQYLCNQEDGNFVLYDASWSTVWYSGGNGGSQAYNFNGWGGDIELVGSQIQTLAASGEATWASTVCSGNDSFACTGAMAASTITAMSAGRYFFSASTILSNAYASLILDSTGKLYLSDATGEIGTNTTPTTIWSHSVSIPTGASAAATFTKYGWFEQGYSSGGAYTWEWSPSTPTSSLTGEAHLELAGCQFLVLDPADQAISTTGTACSYGNYGNNTTWQIN
jgi:hypothetical protein